MKRKRGNVVLELTQREWLALQWAMHRAVIFAPMNNPASAQRDFIKTLNALLVETKDL